MWYRRINLYYIILWLFFFSFLVYCSVNVFLRINGGSCLLFACFVYLLTCLLACLFSCLFVYIASVLWVL